MGFLLFAARKIQLTRKLNEKQYEQMLISQKHEQAVKKVADFQQAMTDMKNMTSVFTNGIVNAAQSQAVMTYLGTDLFKKLQSGATLTEEEQTKVNGAQQAAYVGSQAGTRYAQGVSAVTESIFNAANKTQLAMLQAQSQTLETRLKALDTQVSYIDKQLQAVEKAESNSIDAATPKFGLA